MFGKKLRFLRQSQNLSMDKMIELYNTKFDAKMNKSTLSRYENDLQHPIYTVVKNIADFFNVSVDYLMGWGETEDETEMSEKQKQIMEISKCLSDEDIEKLIDYANLLKQAYSNNSTN